MERPSGSRMDYAQGRNPVTADWVLHPGKGDHQAEIDAFDISPLHKLAAEYEWP